MNQINIIGVVQKLKERKSALQKEKESIPKPSYFDELQNRLNHFHKTKLVARIQLLDELIAEFEQANRRPRNTDTAEA